MSEEHLLSILKKYKTACEKYNYLRKYELNLIDELHANENAHTRILLKLLDFANPEYNFLDDFIKLLNTLLPEKFHIIDSDFQYSKIQGQFSNIDGYITSEHYAIIIENKINGAIDQYKQIENYLNVSRKQKYNDEKIYVVYLTLNGFKKPSDESLTNEAKKLLKYTDEDNKGCFVELNYQDHILKLLDEWLKRISNSNEELLKSALLQYIDYLKGRFYMRDNEKEYSEQVKAAIVDELNLSSYSGKTRVEEIQKIEDDLINLLEDIKKTPMYEIVKRIQNYFVNSSDKVSPFKSVDEWNKNTVVFHNYVFNGISYKLDITVNIDTTLTLTFKREDNNNEQLPDPIVHVLKQNLFNEMNQFHVDSSTTCLSDSFFTNTLEKLFTKLKAIQ